MNKQLNSAVRLLRFIGGLGLASGAITGVLLTAPLVGIMYLLDKSLDLPFVPFSLFDWIARVLPGPIVTFGIDLMIDSILFFGFSVADVAKTAEQAMAVLLFLVIGVAATAAFFAVMKSLNIVPKLMSGMVLALLLGIPMTLVSLPMGQSERDPSLIILGVLIPFFIWGASILWVYRRLIRKSDGLVTEV
ncbi:MAG: hypothetical protein H8E48_05480, partial [Chloroflexi bacterium]|nr:hypothetical protein [Chloroflexota bacterium]